jgi:hypothetical protein
MKKSSVVKKEKRTIKHLKINTLKDKSQDFKSVAHSKDRAFYLVKILGQGAFANVYLVQSRQSG